MKLSIKDSGKASRTDLLALLVPEGAAAGVPAGVPTGTGEEPSGDIDASIDASAAAFASTAVEGGVVDT